MHSAYLQQAATPGRSNRFEKLTHIKQKLREDNCDYLRQSLGDEDFALVYSPGPASHSTRQWTWHYRLRNKLWSAE